MKIYFVRHGKTQWNLERRLQGQTGDSPLLEESYQAVQQVQKILADTVKFDKVISSPQKRAVTTAELLTKLPVIKDDRLAEWNFGQLEGCLITDAVAQYPQEMAASRHHLEKFNGQPFGAEDVDSVLSRFDSLAADLLSSEAENVLLVGHGASGTAGIRHLVGYPVQDLRTAGGLNNNSLSILESKGNHFQMKLWNQNYE